MDLDSNTIIRDRFSLRLEIVRQKACRDLGNWQGTLMQEYTGHGGSLSAERGITQEMARQFPWSMFGFGIRRRWPSSPRHASLPRSNIRTGFGVEPRYINCHDTVRSRSRARGYHSLIGVVRMTVEVRVLGWSGPPKGGTLVVAYLIVRRTLGKVGFYSLKLFRLILSYSRRVHYQ